MIGYEPGDALKFQVLDYDEKGAQDEGVQKKGAVVRLSGSQIH